MNGATSELTAGLVLRLTAAVLTAAFVSCAGPDGTTAPGERGPGADVPPTAPPGSTDPPDSGGGAPGGPMTVTVEMRGIAYRAGDGGTDVTIGLGDRVRWVNRDGTLHTATSYLVPSGGKGFNSGHLDPGSEYEFQPNVTGTWEYACQQYPDRMARARIRVVE